jgi:hypothetical protein
MTLKLALFIPVRASQNTDFRESFSKEGILFPPWPERMFEHLAPSFQLQPVSAIYLHLASKSRFSSHLKNLRTITGKGDAAIFSAKIPSNFAWIIKPCHFSPSIYKYASIAGRITMEENVIEIGEINYAFRPEEIYFSLRT